MCTASLTAGFAAWTAHNLANFRPVSNDEVELMQVGYQLATRGVLGSDMYAGFYGADTHHLWTLPVQHLLDAISFRVFGAGVAQARCVSVIAAVSIVWTTSWLALRWYGLAAALTAEVLLTVWRSDLTAGPTGVPVLDVARVARYDVLAVAFAWLAIAAVDGLSRRFERAGLLIGGACAGLAALSQFFGAFVLPVLMVDAVWRRLEVRPTSRFTAQDAGGRTSGDSLPGSAATETQRHSHGFSAALPGLWWLLAGGAMVVGAWVAYVAAFLNDLRGQLTVYGERSDFLRPSFYLANIFGEPSRYSHLLAQRPPTDLEGVGVVAFTASNWLAVLGIWPALAYLVLARGPRLPLLTLLGAGALLTVFDQTKTPLYAIALVPSVCMALGAALSRLARFWPTLAIALALLSLILIEGVRAYSVDRFESGLVTAYLEVGQRLEMQVTPGGLLLGPERWWWALRDHPYISLRGLWFQWTPETRFVDLVDRWHPSEVVVNNNVRDDVLAFPPALQDQFWEFVAQCTTLVGEVNDPTYFDTQIYRVDECAYRGARDERP